MILGGTNTGAMSPDVMKSYQSQGMYGSDVYQANRNQFGGLYAHQQADQAYNNQFSGPTSTYGSNLAQGGQTYNQVVQGYGGLNNQVQGYIGGLGNVASGLVDQQRAVMGGYGALQKNVMSQIKGVDASQRQAIADTYAQQRGSASQDLISRGLGNTTVRSAVDRGLLADKTKADIALSNQMAQLQAGYTSQLGLAGLGYQGQAVRDYTGLQSQITGMRAGYGTQIGLAGLGYQGQAEQGGQNRALQASIANANMSFRGGGGGIMPQQYGRPQSLGPQLNDLDRYLGGTYLGGVAQQNARIDNSYGGYYAG